MALIKVEQEKCKRDGICVEVCPVGILAMDEKAGPVVRPGAGQFCIGCGHCVAACPHGALDNVRNPLGGQRALPDTPGLGPDAASVFLRSRRSIRCYEPKEVPREDLLRLLDIARYAPSGHNSQGISYLIVQGAGPLRRMRELVIGWMRQMIGRQPEMSMRLNMPGVVKAHERGEDRVLRGAPHLIVSTAPKALRAAQVSTYLALEYVELYAPALGLGTCWAGFAQFCAQDHPAVAEFLKVPEDRQITGMMMVGYPKYPYHRLPERNPLDVAWYEGPVER